MNFFNLTGEKKQKKQNNERKTPTYAQNYNNTVKTVNNAIKNSKRETSTYVNNYSNTVKNTNKKLGIDNETKRTSRNQKIDTNANLNNTRENITLNKAQEYKNSNKAQDKAYKDYTRNDFKNDNDYERFLTENKVSLTSGNALNYINKKAQEQGVSARDFAKGMHTKVNNTLETEKLEQKAKNGELSNNDLESLNQFHAYVDKNNNTIDDDKLQSQADLYKTTVDTINNDVNKLNEQYQKGKIGIDEYQNKYSQLEERWNSNQELGEYLDSVSLKTGFDYYNWAKENNLDVSEFEKYAESFNDSAVERLTEDFAAATTDLINTPVQLYDMAKSIVDKDFNMLDEDNVSTQMANESAKLRNYVMAGTNGIEKVGYQIVDSLMPMAISAVVGNILGTMANVGDVTSFANIFTNVSLGAQGAGQTTRQRLEEGNSAGSSVVNGIIHGAITGLVEGLDAGKVASIFTGEAKNYILGTALLGKVSFNNVAKFLNAVGSSEGAEEVIETFADWGADHVQNLIGRTIFKENYDPVEVTQLDPQEMAQEFALAYAGAVLLGLPSAVSVTVNSKATYNSAMEARNYAESVLNSPIADEGSKRIAELTIQAIDDDINNYNQTKTPLSDGVTFESEKAQPLGTFDEALENLVQATRLDIKDNLAQTVGVMENIQKTSGLIQQGLNERGININAFDYMNLPSEAKQNVKSLMKTINGMDGGFPYEVAFDGSLDSSINGYIKDGKIVLNPNIDNNYQSVLSHEITHTLENSNNYQNIKNLIKESSDYQEYYDKYSKLYKGVADNIESEVLAKYIENHLGDKNLIDKLVKYDESLGYRIFENLKSNLSSDLDTKVENSWLKAFKETNRSTHSGLQYDKVNHLNENGDILSKEQIESRTQQQFKQTVKDIVQNKNNDTNNAILVSEYSPDWMIKSGYNDKPLLITKKHIESAMGLGNSRNLHNVSEKVVSELPSLIKDPIAVLNYRGNDLLAILKATDKDGNILITAIKPDGTGTYNNIEIDSNFIKSLYGKDSVVRYLDKVIDDKNVVYSNVGNSKVDIAKEIMKYQQVSDYMKKGSITPELQSLDRNTSFENNLPKNSEEVNFFDTNDKNLKAKQLEIIQNNNPILDDYHTWIRSVEDIKTFQEALNDSDYKEYFDSGEDFDESYTNKMAKEALEKGSIRVYSSYPIKDGIFVTPSIMEAQSYSGDGKVYSKVVNLNDVAWVDPTQGQYAKVSGNNTSKPRFSLNDNYQGIENINEVESLQQNFIDNFERFGLETKRNDINRVLKKDLTNLTQYIIDNGKIDETLKNDVIDDLIKAGKTRGVDFYGLEGQSNPREIRNYLKKSGTIWDSIKDDVTDKGDFIKRHFGTFGFREGNSTKGQLSQSWDAQLQELMNLFPGFISQNEAENIKTGYEYVELVDNKLADLNEKWNGYHFDELNWGMNEAEFESKVRERASATLDLYAQEINQTAGVDKRMGDLVNKTAEENLNQLLNNPEELEKEYASLFGDEAPNNITNNEPYRNSEIPSYNESGKVSKGAKTIADSYLVSDETSNKIIERAKQGKLNTRGYTNEKVNGLVDEKINELGTFDNCYDFVMGKVTVEDGAVAHALGTRLIQSVEAQIDDLKANNGDTNTIKNLQKTVDNLSSRTIQLSSASGDTVRQHATFKGMTKEGQIEFIKESIQDIQDQLNRQRKGEAPTLELKQEFIDEWNNATTEEQKQAVAEKIVQDIGSQIPPTIIDQLNAWRHLSMLFNPRTWIKNYLANIVSGQVATLKQTVQTGIEGIMFARENPSETKINDFIKNEENIKKAKELGISPSDYAKMELGKHAGMYNPVSDRALLNELVKDYDNNYKNFKSKYAGGDISTYIGSGEFAKSVNEARKQFSSDTLNKFVDIQSKFMSDAPAMRKAYAKTMIGWLKANNLTFENLTKEQLAYARDYAFNQARIITFNEESKMANAIGKFSNTNMATKLIVDSMVPFKRTPINILKQGVNYSPVGLLKTITYNAYQLSKGEITTSQFTSNLASGLTGAGVMGLGYILAKMGIFRTTDDDKDKKQNFDKDNGEQDYAIVTPNGTYTIDWLDPFIMPLSMGAEVANSDSVLSADDAFDLFLAMENPIFETSMLSGLRKSFQSYDKDESSWFNNLVATMLSNYVSQFVPTIFGATARTIDDTRRTTYPNEGTIDKTTKTIANKIPFLSKTNQPYINKEGQEQKNEDLGMGALGRAFLNFASPGYYSSKKIDKYDEELYRLYSETGVSSVLPSDSTKSVEYGGDTYKLLGEDYTNWNKTRLSTETDFVNKFIDSEEYSNYDDSQKAKIIGDIRTYAGQKAKKEFLENNNVEYDDTAYKKASEALQNDLELYQYYGANDYYNDLSGDDKKGNYLDYIKGLETSSKGKNYLYDTKYGDTKLNSYINDMGIDDDQKFAAKEVNAKAQSAKDSNGKTITNSKALAVAKGYEDAGILDDVFEYIEKNGLEPKDVGLTKTVSKYTEDEILEAYEEIFGSGGTISSKSAKSSRNGSKSSSSKVSSKTRSNATTTVKAQARLGTNTSAKKSQNYSNVDYISAYLNALEKKNKELQNKYSEKLYE